MPIQPVLPEHTPNQGREIWNANDQELLSRFDSLGLDVKAPAFGAKGDGVADDLPALQKAIDTCYQRGGGWVFLPTGTYRLGGSLLLRDHVNILGMGMFNSILRLADNINLPVVTDEGHSADPSLNHAFGSVHLANFAIDGNKAGNPGGQEGLLTSAYFSIFENLLIRECGTHGIRMGDRKLVNASSQNRVSGCRIFNCNAAGIYLDINGIDHNITENYIYGCDVGILIKNGGVRVVNNDIYRHASAAIDVEQTSYGLVIASNDFNGNRRTTIHVSRTRQPSERSWSQFLITGNSILGDGLEADNLYDAIHIETSVDAGISNLTIVSNKIFALEAANRYRYGIHLEKNVTDTRCAANHISRVGTSGYFIGASCARVDVDSLGGGPLPAPQLPASGQPFQNPYPVAVSVYVSSGLVRDVAIDGAATGLNSGNFYLPVGKTITLVYDQAPVWAWFSH
jgi:parallel beta-helix repeat protein